MICRSWVVPHVTSSHSFERLYQHGVVVRVLVAEEAAFRYATFHVTIGTSACRHASAINPWGT